MKAIIGFQALRRIFSVYMLKSKILELLFWYYQKRMWANVSVQEHFSVIILATIFFYKLSPCTINVEI